MKHKLFFPIVLVAMLFASVYPASAITCSGSTPEIPHHFFGNITYSNGTPLAFSDNNITAVLGDNSFSTTTNSNGGYGGTSTFDVYRCSGSGSTITFYVQGGGITTYTFSSDAVTKLDLNLSGEVYCGDSACNGNETQESDNTYPYCNRDCGARVNSYSIANSSVTSSTAAIAWTSNKISNSTVSYGTTTALGSTNKSSDYTTSHNISLINLSASTTYYYNITSCDVINNSVGCVTNGTYSFTTSAAATTTTTTTTTNTGGGGGTSTSTGGTTTGTETTTTTTTTTPPVSESKTIAAITAGTTGTVVFTKSEQIAVTKIDIETKSSVSSVTVTSTESSKPAAAPLPVESSSGSVYKYIEIKAENIKTDDINRAFISFSVPKTWIITNSLDPNTVALNRLSGNVWTKLATSKVSEDSSTYYFKAETPGFSTFAITAEKKAEAPAAGEKPSEGVQEQPPAQEKPPVKGEGVSTSTIAIIAVIVVVLGIVGYLFISRKNK